MSCITASQRWLCGIGIFQQLKHMGSWKVTLSIECNVSDFYFFFPLTSKLDKPSWWCIIPILQHFMNRYHESIFQFMKRALQIYTNLARVWYRCMTIHQLLLTKICWTVDWCSAMNWMFPVKYLPQIFTMLLGVSFWPALFFDRIFMLCFVLMIFLLYIKQKKLLIVQLLSYCYGVSPKMLCH